MSDEVRQFVLDVEVLTNYILFLFKSFKFGENGTLVFGEEFPFEKWKKTNNSRTKMPKFLRTFESTVIVYAFHGNGYDMVMLKLVMDKDFDVTFEEMKARNDQIIHGDEKWYKLPDLPFRHGDLQEILNLNRKTQMDGKASKTYVSLKESVANIGFGLVRDLPVNPDFDINVAMKKDVYDYCNLGDCDGTAFLASWAQQEIQLRLDLEELFGVDVFNKGEPRVAKTILTKLYKEQTGNNAYELAKERWGTEEELEENLKKVWFNFKEFIPGPKHYLWHDKSFESFYRKLRGFSRHYYQPRFNDTLESGKVAFRIGEGGLHDEIDNAGVYVTEKDWHIYQVDAGSFYPFILQLRNLYPRHLPGCREVYWPIVTQRLAWKDAGEKVKAGRTKIIINSFFGMLLDKYSPFLEPTSGIATTITGQLYLLQFIDWLLKVGIEIIHANTDGIIIRVHKSKEAKFRKVLEFFSKTYKLRMDVDDLSKAIKKNVNSYMLIDSEDRIIKAAKDFNSKWHPKSPMAGTIIAKALKAYYHKGVAIEKTIGEADDIRDFLFVKGSSKKSWNLLMEFDWSDAPVVLQNTMRWYVSKRGGYMRREAINSNRTEAIMKEVKLMPLLRLEELDPNSYGDLDKEWYINEAKKRLI